MEVRRAGWGAVALCYRYAVLTAPVGEDGFDLGKIAGVVAFLGREFDDVASSNLGKRDVPHLWSLVPPGAEVVALISALSGHADRLIVTSA